MSNWDPKQICVQLLKRRNYRFNADGMAMLKPRNGRNPIDPKRPDINIPKNTPPSVNIKPQTPDTFQKRSITEE